MLYEIETLISFLERLLVRASFDKDEASAIAKSLTLSERLGYSSHGIAQISRYIAELEAGNIVSGARPKILHETSNSLVVDAQFGVGQVVMPVVLQNVHSKLITQASVTAAVRNCGHIGRLGEWVEYPAETGYAALLFVNDNGLNRIVAPRRQARRHKHKSYCIQHSARGWADLFRRYVDWSNCPWQGQKREAHRDGGAARLPPGRRGCNPERRCSRFRREAFFLWGDLKDIKGLRCLFSSISLSLVCQVVRRHRPRQAPKAKIA